MSHSKHGIIIIMTIICLHRFCVECIRDTWLFQLAACIVYSALIYPNTDNTSMVALFDSMLLLSLSFAWEFSHIDRCDSVKQWQKRFAIIIIILYFIFCWKLQQLHTAFVFCITAAHCTSLHVNHISLEICFFSSFSCFFICSNRFYSPYTRSAQLEWYALGSQIIIFEAEQHKKDARFAPSQTFQL